MNPYWNKYYKATVIDKGFNELTVSKNQGSDWSEIEMAMNDNKSDRITLKSQDHAEQLHFLLGQLIATNEAEDR